MPSRLVGESNVSATAILSPGIPALHELWALIVGILSNPLTPNSLANTFLRTSWIPRNYYVSSLQPSTCIWPWRNQHNATFSCSKNGHLHFRCQGWCQYWFLYDNISQPQFAMKFQKLSVSLGWQWHEKWGAFPQQLESSWKYKISRNLMWGYHELYRHQNHENIYCSTLKMHASFSWANSPYIPSQKQHQQLRKRRLSRTQPPLI